MVSFVKDFENYVLSDFSEDIKNSFIPGSESLLYVTILNQLKSMTETNTLPPNLINDVKELEKKNNRAFQEVLLLSLLKEYDLKTTTPERKTEILQTIKNKFFGNINYNYPKPSRVNQNNLNSQEIIKYHPKLDETLFNPDQVVKELFEKIQKDKKNDKLYDIFDLFNASYIPKLIKLNDLSDGYILTLLEGMSNSKIVPFQLNIHANDAFIAKIAKILSKNEKLAEKDYLTEQLLANMTTLQIGVFERSIESDKINKDLLTQQLLNRNFLEKIESTSDSLEKRKIFIEMYEFLKTKPSKYYSQTSDALLFILENGIENKIYDLNYFKDYLKKPIIENHELWEKEKIVEISKQKNRYNMCNLNVKNRNEETTIISQYLKHFFVYEGHKMDEFKSFFKNDYLLVEFIKAQILLGQDHPDASRLLGGAYETLIKKIELTMCPHNKKVFGVKEPVSIEVDVKNVQTLFVKIFEINTENYFYSKKTDIDSAISLEGLVATYEETFIYNEKPQRIVRRKFDFDKIPMKRGFFIIEFIGNGHSSRAIIKKGSLSLITRDIFVGKKLFILNEDNVICKSKGTGIWLNTEFYEVNMTSGEVIIPYQRSSSQAIAIFLHEGFAEIGKINLMVETYALNGSFVLNHESLIMGNSAKVLVKPELMINNMQASKKLLLNSKVTLNLVKTENEISIPIQNIFDNLKMNEHEEFEIEFQVPPKLTSIELLYEAEVKNNSQFRTDKLNFRKNYNFLSVREDTECAKFFLRNCEGFYYLSVLGKNGEKKDKLEVKLDIQHSIVNNVKTQTCQTDENGEIFLGKLNDVISIHANTFYLGVEIAQLWNLPSRYHYSYPSQYDIIENEAIKIPICPTLSQLGNLTLVRQSAQGVILENYTSHLNFMKYDDDHTHLEIKGLKKGLYILSSIDGSIQLNINIHSGKYWDESEKFLVLDNKIIENSNSKVSLHLEEFKLVQDDKSQTLKIRINNKAENPRVHLFVYQYLPSDPNDTFQKLDNLASAAKYTKNHNIQGWTNMYLSNRVLNEEIQYVLERKQLERFMGNSLEKPTLLMHKQFIRDTTTSVQEVKEGTNYDKKFGREMLSQQQAMGGRANLAKKRISTNVSGKRANITYDLSSFHNFLEHSPLILLNLKPNENNEIIVDGYDFSKYSTIQAIVMDEKSIYEENLFLKHNPLISKDLTLAATLDLSKSFSELRKTELLTTGTKFEINDITSTTFKIIDSIEKFISYSMIVSPNLKNEWENFKFLLKFNNMPEEKKLKNVSNFFSHELNIFLYFKCPDFFRSHIRNIIKFKAEKTFVDLFLLEDEASINEICNSPSKLSQLNAMEQCLLIYSIRNKNKDLAESIVNNLKCKADEVAPNANELKRLFTILMNMKIDDQTKGLADKIHKEKESEMKKDKQPSSMSAPREMDMRDMKMSKFMAPQSMNLRSMNKPRKEKECLERDMDDDFESYEESFIQELNVKNTLNKDNGKSKEYCEMHYYNRLYTQQYSAIVTANLFWSDLATYLFENPKSTLSNNFLSKWLLLPPSNLTQLVGIISFLDLPITTQSHQFERVGGRGLSIIPGSNTVLFTKEISETKENIKTNLMIAQNVTLQKKPQNDDADENQNYIDALLINDIVTIETIVTNISNKKITFELLVQIPQGSIPAFNSDFTRTINYSLDQFKTQKFETFVYFPKTGKYSHYPSTISIDGTVVSKASELIFDIKEKIVRTSMTNLDDILESGSKKDILDFLENMKYLKSSYIKKIYWLLKEKDFFIPLIDLLRKKNIYDINVWNFGFYHNDPKTIKEIMDVHPQLKSFVGCKFSSSLITVDDTNNYEILPHLDYSPMFNARAHSLGGEQKNSIMNNELKKTYEDFIIYLLKREKIDDKCYLRLCYYLILQERIEDADRVLQKVNPKNFTDYSSYMIQYDYLLAYIDFSYKGFPEFKKAREVFVKYKNFPLSQWNELFEEIEDQLIEYEGKQIIEVVDENADDDKKKKQMVKNAILTEPKLELTIENKSLQIIHSNISSLTIKFYFIDLEILFSRTPFIKQGSEDFSYVQPNLVDVLTVENATDEKILNYKIPDQFVTKNLFVEVNSTNKKKSGTYYSISLKTTIIESMGELKVSDPNMKGLPKVYVKCYAKYKDGSVKFYKDGYTDLRGKFNYVSLNTDQLMNVQQYSILIIHDEFGSIIKECKPPANMTSSSIDIPVSTQPISQYEQYQNYRQDRKVEWRNLNKKK